MQFYRIEHKETRLGVYQGNTVNWKSFNTSASDKHPMPDNDSQLSSAYGKELLWDITIRFGFNSLEQLKNWFYNNEMLQELADNNHIISLYECPFAFEGNTQCVIKDIYHKQEFLKKEFSPLELINK